MPDVAVLDDPAAAAVALDPVRARFAASAASYVVAPGAMGAAGADPRRVSDRLSASYLLALAARAVGEVGALARRATAAGKRLPTLSIFIIAEGEGDQIASSVYLYLYGDDAATPTNGRPG